MPKLSVFIAIILIISQLFSIDRAMAAADTFNVDLTVEGELSVCDNDGLCEAGEHSGNCPNDCGCNNDGFCQIVRGENSDNCSNDCPTFSGGGELPDNEPPAIYGVYVTGIGFFSANIIWQTTEPAECVLFLGKTIDYETVVFTETDFQTEHQADFSGLLINNLYNFKIVCSDRKGNQSETSNRQFSTASLFEEEELPNVDDFAAEGQDEQVDLTWENPIDDDFAEVLIVRSKDFFPQKPWEGEPVYQGKETSVKDINVENDVTYYYTAFTYDKSGKYSSGAIAKAIPHESGKEPPVEPLVKPSVEPAPPEVEKITLKDFDFLQNGDFLAVSEDGVITLKSDALLIAKIDYEKVPEVLKTIMVTLEKDNKYFSFLLRIDDDKTKYLATLQPPEPGVYPMTIYVLDYKNQALKTINGKFVVKDAAANIGLILWWQEEFMLWLILVFLTLICVFLFYYLKKKRKKEQNYPYF